MTKTRPIELEERFNSIVEEDGKFLRQAIVQLCPKDLGLQFNDIKQETRGFMYAGAPRVVASL